MMRRRRFVFIGWSSRGRKESEPKDPYADDQPAYPQAAPPEAVAQQGAGAERLAATPRRLHARLYDYAEEAELGAAEGRQGAPDDGHGSGLLHPRRGPQSAGALGGAHPRRPREGPSRRSLSHPARRARHARGEGPQAAAFALRRQTAEMRN